MQRLETCLLIAEADRILCHLVMSLTVFFYLMFQRAANKIILCNSWLVCLLHFRSSILTGKPEQLLSLMCFFFSVS